MWHPQLQGRVVHYFVLFLGWCWLFITCDWIFLAVEIFILMCNRVVSTYYCCFGLYFFCCWFLEWRNIYKISAILRRNLELKMRLRMRCLLCCGWFISWGGVTFLVRFDMCYCHHIEMISVIKFCCHSVFPAAAQTGRGIMFMLLA